MSITNQNDVCNDIAYLNSIDQKQRFQLLNIPPVRYNNFATNPYTKRNPGTGLFFTKSDLDMRRKVEILKYDSNRMSTQTNSLTKANKYAQAVNGSLQRRTYSQIYLQQNLDASGVLKPCPPVQTPSSACDVPGPTIFLYEDDNVPLYNYGTNAADAYGIQNQAPNPYPFYWNYIRYSNVANPYSASTTNYSTFTTIYVVYTDTPSYTFSIQTPISMRITGQLQNGVLQNYTDVSAAIRISINSITINVKYSYTNVTLSPSPTVIYEHGKTGIPINMGVTLTNTSRAFAATAYLGVLQINNLQLPTQRGYIYDIQANINYQVLYPSNNYASYCDPPTITSYFDISLNQVYPPVQTNCSVQGATPIPISTFPSLFVSGVPNAV
jgi:hypothetical protein